MSNDSEWVSLRQAAEILGVHPATVRNWADKGELRSRRTPGGHRRFLKSDLLQYTHSQEDLQPLEIQVIIQNALGQTRMQVNDGELANLPWYSAMSQQTRQRLREEGRRVLDALRQYMAQGAPESGLSMAITLGKDYAAILSADGLTLPQAVRGFFFFSNFVINSILTWSELAQPRNLSEWANLVRQVNNFIHAMLLSIIEYYEEE